MSLSWPQVLTAARALGGACCTEAPAVLLRAVLSGAGPFAPVRSLLLVLPGKPSAFLGTGMTGMSLGHILKTQNLCYVASGRGHLTAGARIGALRTPLAWCL